MYSEAKLAFVIYLWCPKTKVFMYIFSRLENKYLVFDWFQFHINLLGSSFCHKLLQGTTYVYDAFFRPVVLKHEPEIDKNILELRTRAGDMLFLYWQKAASYGQTRVFDILQYIASQSNPPPPTQVFI